MHIKEGLMTEAQMVAPSSSGDVGVVTALSYPMCFLGSQGIPGSAPSVLKKRGDALREQVSPRREGGFCP